MRIISCCFFTLDLRGITAFPQGCHLAITRTTAQLNQHCRSHETGARGMLGTVPTHHTNAHTLPQLPNTQLRATVDIYYDVLVGK